MKMTNTRPTAPGWYWYEDEFTERCAARVFVGDSNYFGQDNLVADVPGYEYFVQVSELSGEWSDEALPIP